MADFNDFLQDIKSGITTLAETSFKDLKEQVVAAGYEFIGQSEDELKLWTAQLAVGEMSTVDFEWLVKSKKDLAELIFLKQKGLAKAQIDKFTTGLFDVIVSSAIKSFVV
jgi:hypothetical protein